MLAVTPSRLYFFAGGPSLEAAAQLAVSLSGAQGPEPVVELPGRMPTALLHVYGKSNRRPDRCASPSLAYSVLFWYSSLTPYSFSF